MASVSWIHTFLKPCMWAEASFSYVHTGSFETDGHCHTSKLSYLRTRPLACVFFLGGGLSFFLLPTDAWSCWILLTCGRWAPCHCESLPVWMACDCNIMMAANNFNVNYVMKVTSNTKMLKHQNLCFTLAPPSWWHHPGCKIQWPPIGWRPTCIFECWNLKCISFLKVTEYPGNALHRSDIWTVVCENLYYIKYK